jgi:hypothetical protein
MLYLAIFPIISIIEYINLIEDDLPEEDSDMQRAIAESLDLNVAEKTNEEATYV